MGYHDLDQMKFDRAQYLAEALPVLFSTSKSTCMMNCYGAKFDCQDVASPRDVAYVAMYD